MAKTETLHIRVNENVKANAEETLAMLGISISEAVNMFLCQVNLTGGIPFEVKVPANIPLAMGSLSKAQFDFEIAKGVEDIKAGRIYTADEVEKELKSEFNI